MKQLAACKRYVLIACAIAGSLSAFVYVNVHASKNLDINSRLSVAHEVQGNVHKTEDGDAPRIPIGVLPRTEPLRKALELLGRILSH
ncbi:MAG: hypothetical protein ACK4NS_01810 [Saprospiraceae bacterium]